MAAADFRASGVPPGAPTKAGYFSSLAWLAYIAFDVVGYWRLALLSGAIVMVVIVAIEYRHHAVKITDATSLGFFAVMLWVTMAIGSWLIARYNVLIVWGVFAAVFWASIAMSFPFTLQFAREQTPPEAWDHPLFVQSNYRNSVLWAIIATVNAILGIAMHLSSYPLTVGVLLPTILMILGFVASAWYGKHVAAQFEEPPAAPAVVQR